MPAEMDGLDLARLSSSAKAAFGGAAITTPLVRSETLSYGDNDVLVKRADLLPGGCFKFLSAMCSVAGLSESERGHIVFATAGSYGIGVGHAINSYGGHATAIMPEGSNEEKQAIMEGLGVEIVVPEGCVNFDEAEEYAQRYSQQHGATRIHPFASRNNAIGTGILGVELDRQSPGMTHVVLQFGGGSLTTGVGMALRQLRPEVHVAAAQVRGCSPFVDSVRTGEVEEADDISSHIMPSFFARLGGVGVGKTHPMTLGAASHVVDSADIVTSGSVYATMHDVNEELGVLPEFAGAVGLEEARALARTPGIEGATIVAILTGNHADDYKLDYLARKSGRRAQEESGS